MKAYVMANGDIIYIVVPNTSSSITFQWPDNRNYNSVILHINTSVVNYTISLGPIRKVSIHITISAFMYLHENDENNFYKSHYYPIEKNFSIQGDYKKYFPQGNYRLLSFHIEEDNRIPYIGCPATTTNVSIDGINNRKFTNALAFVMP